MLTIRKAQTDVLREYMIGRFVDRMVVHLSSRFPEKCRELGDSEIREWIREGMRRCRAYELKSEAHVAGFVELMFLVSPEFDYHPESPWIRTTLEDKNIPPRKKLDIVRDEIGRNDLPTESPRKKQEIEDGRQ